MNLQHFNDPFQGEQASFGQFFDHSNMLTSQPNPGYEANTGYGYVQNSPGYDWQDHSHQQDAAYGQENFGGYSQEFRGNGGYHGQMAMPQQCGADPSALARANLAWEEHMTHGNGMGSGQMLSNQPGHTQEEESPEDYSYLGPDALEYDDEETAPTRGVEYWKKRVPTIVIHSIAIAIWMGVWSKYGFSAALPGTSSTLLYWGFVIFMIWGMFQADHRAARYEDEREVMTSVEANSKMMVRGIAAAATLLLTFKVLKGKTKSRRTLVFTALAIAFFASLVALVSMSMKKRGEVVRRYRKIKAALFNLSIAFTIVGAFLTFDIGTTLAAATSQSGGASSVVEAPKTGGVQIEQVTPPPPPPTQAPTIRMEQ